MPTAPAIRQVRGIKIRSLSPNSCFYKAGARKGDVVISINVDRINDELDFRFFSAAASVRMELLRGGGIRTITVEREPGSFPGIEFYPKPIRRCANRCIFCFIDQMPPGLRGALYIKDEDLTHSFLNGNYVTLSNADESDIRKAASLGLSPLYVSVHATDPAVRNRMLGNRRAPPVMRRLSALRKNGIGFHTQIVVCPGYNDGPVLTRTIRDLLSLGSSLLSIAVVPVGVTRFRKRPLEAVNEATAQEICAFVGAVSDRDAADRGTRRLFCADELFIKAKLPIPPRLYYAEYPQIENGVGLVRQLLEEWNEAKRSAHWGAVTKRRRGRGKKLLLLTSVSALRFISGIADQMHRLRPDVTIRAEAVKNRFFGESVTVAGLLTGRDILSTARAAAKTERFDTIFVPPVMFNYAGYTLDGFSVRRLAQSSGLPIAPLISIRELTSA